MDYASFLSDRTVLSLPTTTTPEALASDGELQSTEQSAFRDIWRFLLSSRNGLTYYRPSDFSRLPAVTAPGIGEGTSFRVDRAIVNEIGTNLKVVAVKYLKSTDASTVIHESEYKSLLLELKILVHDVIRTCPQVVDLLGYGCESKHGGLSLYVVSEYSRFGTLKDFLSQQGASLGLYQKAKLCCDVARGLEKVHASKLAHGDVKLENALVFSDGDDGHTVKISDFGHARLDDNQRYLGTRIFNAPEVRSSDNTFPTSIIDHQRCDIYSYGILVWEVLRNGRRFFEGNHQIETIESLSKLPKDELYRRALHTCSTIQADRIYCKTVLQKVFGVSLRDDPKDRQRFTAILDIFESESSFKRPTVETDPFALTRDLDPESNPDHYISLVDSDPAQATSAQPLADSEQSAGRIPPEVEQELFQQAQDRLGTISDVVDLRETMFYLSNAYLNGFGTEVDLTKMLFYLKEAAELGQTRAALTVARLHDALEQPVSFSSPEMQSLARLEDELRKVPDELYLCERIRKYERHHRSSWSESTITLSWSTGSPAIDFSLRDVDRILDFVRSTDNDILQATVLSTNTQLEQMSLLHFACRTGLRDIVEELLRKGAKLNSRGPGNKTPLISAAMGGHTSLVCMLLEKGANPQLKDKNNLTPLHLLIMFEDSDIQEVLTQLLAAGADLHAGKASLTLDEHGLDAFGSPLHFAIVARNMKLAQALLSIDPRPDLACMLEDPLTPLFVATYNKYPEFVKFLLGYATSNEEKQYLFMSLAYLSPGPALRQLMVHGSGWKTAMEATVTELINAGCDINFPPEYPFRPLLFAIKNGQSMLGFNLLEILMRHGANPGTDSLALIGAIQSRTDGMKKSIIDFVLSQGVLTDLPELLYLACSKGATEIIETLVESYLDVRTMRSWSKFRPMHLAASVTGNARILEILLDHGADIDGLHDKREILPDDPNEKFDQEIMQTELARAYDLISQNTAVGTQAVENGKVRSMAFDNGDGAPVVLTPLETCVGLALGDGEMIDILVARGSILINNEYTILHIAATSKCKINGIHVSRHLLRHDSVRRLINVQVDSMTPLSYACLYGNVDAALCYLEAGGVTPDMFSQDFLSIFELCGRQTFFNSAWRDEYMDLESWRRSAEKLIGILIDIKLPGSGRTPLHFAAALGNYSRVVELVESGADVNAKDMDDKTPLQYLQDALIFNYEAELEPSATAFEEDRARISKYLEEQMLLAEKRIKLDSVRNLDSDESGEQLRIKYETEIQKYTSEHGLDDARTLESRMDLAEMLSQERKYEEAEKLTRQVKEQWEISLPKGHGSIFRARLVLLDTLVEQKKIDEAESLALETVDIASTVPETSVSDKLAASLKLLYVRSHKNRSENVTETREALSNILQEETALTKELESIYPPNHHLVMDAELGKASTLALLDDWDRAAEIVLDLAQRLPNIITGHRNDYVAAFNSLFYSTQSIQTSPCSSRLTDSCRIFTVLYDGALETRGPASSYTLEAQLGLIDNLLSQEQHGLAAEHLARRVETLKEKNGDTDIDTIKTMLRLAFVEELSGRWVESAVYEGQVIDILDSSVGPTHTETLEAKRKLSFNWTKQKLYPAAELLAQEVYEAYKTTIGSNDQRTLDAQADLAYIIECDEKRYSEAAEHWKEIIAKSQELNGVSHVSTIRIMNRLADNCSLQGKASDAQEIYKKSLGLCQTALGDSHPTTAKSMEGLIIAYTAGDNHEEACELGQKLFDLNLKVHGKDSSKTVDARSILARCYFDAERFDECIEQQKQVVDARKLQHGGSHVSVFDAECWLGKAYRDIENYEEAEKLFLDALAGTESLLGEACESSIEILYLVAEIFVLKESFPEAQEWGEKLQTRSTRVLGDDHQVTRDAEELLATVYEARETWTKADIMLRRVLKKMSDRSEEYEEIWSLKIRLAFVAQQLQHYDEAEGFCREVLEQQRERLGNDHEGTLDTVSCLSMILVDLEEYDKAEELALECLHSYEQILEEDDNRTMDVRRTLSMIYNATDPSKAEAINKQILESTEQSLGPDHPATLDAMSALASTYTILDRLEEAEDLQVSVVIGRREADPQADELPGLYQAISDLEDNYERQERWDEAEPLALEIANGWQNLAESRGDERLLEAWRALERVYIAQGRSADAQEVTDLIQSGEETAKLGKGEYEIERQLQEEQPELWAEIEKMRARGMSLEDITEIMRKLAESMGEEQ